MIRHVVINGCPTPLRIACSPIPPFEPCQQLKSFQHSLAEEDSHFACLSGLQDLINLIVLWQQKVFTQSSQLQQKQLLTVKGSPKFLITVRNSCVEMVPLPSLSKARKDCTKVHLNETNNSSGKLPPAIQLLSPAVERGAPWHCLAGGQVRTRE